jgi:hypothetical protein
MNARRVTALALLLAVLPPAAGAAGRGGGGGFRGGGGYRGGGFDLHNDAANAHPQTYNHSSTGPAGTNRTTTATNTGNGYNRTTTATNGNASRTSSGSYNANTGNFNHSTSGSNGYGSRSGSTSGNVNSGNYSHNASGSNPYGSYNTSGNGNAYNHTYNGSTTATNAWGQTYHASTSAYNGVVYHGATVTNPVYGGTVWGWNGGYAWYPAPYYYGGGFWGAFAIGVTSAAVYGSIVANSVTYTSYQIQPESPGAKLLASYQLTQTPCGPAGLVVIYGPNNSVICAHPNNLVAAGNYSVDSKTLTIVSAAPAA